MWINCNEKMPEDMVVVIALYSGYWPERGNGGVTDIYTADGVWINVPDTVAIIGWMPMPDTKLLPITGHCTGSNSAPATRRFLGCIETDSLPEISECIFEGDYSEIKYSKLFYSK